MKNRSDTPHWLDLKEEILLKDCRFEAFRGPGPGGQKRNKTSNSIRLTHLPSGDSCHGRGIAIAS